MGLFGLFSIYCNNPKPNVEILLFYYVVYQTMWGHLTGLGWAGIWLSHYHQFVLTDLG